jgi:capsular polysaccharide transport system permease protein
MGAASFLRQMTDAGADTAARWRTISERVPLFFILIVAVPTVIAAIYMYLIAAPMYVSETHFVVRSRSGGGASAFGVVLASVGLDLGSGETDSYEVDEYIMSRDAMANLINHHDLRAIIARPEADFLSKFPRFYQRDTFENLFKSYPRFVNIGYDSSTGINTLKVQAFRSSDAQLIANALLDGAEKLVNELNRRASDDLISQAENHVAEAQTRAARAEIALTDFRTREKLIDPTRSSAAGSEIVTQLDTQIIAAEAERSSLAVLAPQSPSLPDLDEKIRALQQQRNQESVRVVGESDSLAPKIGEYERLQLDRDYAAKSLAAADATLEEAQIDAHKKAIYLERVVEPDLPDQAEEPERTETVAIVLVSALIAYSIIMLVAAGLREHKQV